MRHRRAKRGQPPWNRWPVYSLERFKAFLPIATYPVRAGVHSNTAFAVRLSLDYPDETLRALLTDAALRWYLADADCQAWEPGGDEFLSPALIEAECMRAALPAREFRHWFDGVLPRLGQSLPATLFTPATRQRPQRRKDRPSRRIEPQSRLVLACTG